MGHQPKGKTDGPYSSFVFFQWPTSDVGLIPGQIQNTCDQMHFWSLHPGGSIFLLADGSVRFMNYSANSILPALATKDGGEAIGEF